MANPYHFIREEDGVEVFMPNGRGPRLPSGRRWSKFVAAKKRHAIIDDDVEIHYRLVDGHLTMIDGEAKVPCINCQIPWKQLEMAEIRIGALCKVEEHREIPGKPNAIEVTHKVIPLTTHGLGCPICVDLYRAEERKIEAENALRSQLYDVEMKIANIVNKVEAGNGVVPPRVRCKHGLIEAYCAACKRLRPIHKVVDEVRLVIPKKFTPRVAWIDVGEELMPR